VVTGVAAYFTPDQLTNKKVCVIVNLGSSPCKGAIVIAVFVRSLS